MERGKAPYGAGMCERYHCLMIFVTLKQEVDYYPFGMTMRMPDKSSENKYLYNPEKLRFFEPLAFRGSSKNYANHRFAIFRDGKELQDDLGLDWYDYGAGLFISILSLQD